MQQENLMGTMPIPQLIIKTSIPLIISLLVNNLYNLVDSIFVSRVSEEALTGIALAAPLQMIMIALGCGLAVGLNAMVSKALGEKKQEEVKKTTSAAIVMAFGAYLINACWRQSRILHGRRAEIRQLLSTAVFISGYVCSFPLVR